MTQAPALAVDLEDLQALLDELEELVACDEIETEQEEIEDILERVREGFDLVRRAFSRMSPCRCRCHRRWGWW